MISFFQKEAETDLTVIAVARKMTLNLEESDITSEKEVWTHQKMVKQETRKMHRCLNEENHLLVL